MSLKKFKFVEPLTWLLNMNKFFGYADYSTLVEVVLSSDMRVAVADTLNQVTEWCDLWGMKLNVSKTKMVSRSLTIFSSNTH